MKTTELRIGNYVKDPYNKEIKIVSVNNKDGGMLNPIPLTDGRLLKFGFERIGLLVLGDFEIGLDGDDFLKKQKTVVYKNSIHLKIKYVHQLQNLYFALTGTEL